MKCLPVRECGLRLVIDHTVWCMTTELAVLLVLLYKEQRSCMGSSILLASAVSQCKLSSWADLLYMCRS